MTNKKTFADQVLLASLYQGTFGIEVEEHRVSLKRRSLSQRAHPNSLGNRHHNPFFQTDFAESQEELVTSPHHSTKSCLNHLHSLQAILQASLNPDDIIWPLSMPPKLNQDDLDYLPKGFRNRPWYQKYLEKMLEKYGPYYGLMAGIHINYAPTKELLEWYRLHHQLQDKVVANNQMLFQIAQQVLGYRWLFTYLFGASPIIENKDDTIPEKQRKMQPVRSYRSSKYGFNNDTNFEPDYSSLDNFISQLEHYIKTGDLVAPSDFHGPVRLKGAPTFEALTTLGAGYLEFRIFDLNPFSQDGISQNTMSFLHLLIMDAVINPQPWDAIKLKRAEARNNLVALQHPVQSVSQDAQDEAKRLLHRLAEIVQAAPEELRIGFNKALNFANTCMLNPRETTSGKLQTFIKDKSLVNYGIVRGEMIKNDYRVEPKRFKFKTIPMELLSAYQKTHQLGLPTQLNENKLLVTIKDKQYTLKNNGELNDILQTNN